MGRKEEDSIPVSNEQLAPPPAFTRLGRIERAGQLREALSDTDPGSAIGWPPAITSLAKISLARRPVMVCCL